MDASFIWQSLAQGGIAILVLGSAAHLIWKRYAAALDEQRADIAQMRAEIKTLQGQKDGMHEAFNKRLMDLQESHFTFMKETTMKYELLSREHKQSIDHNTDALNGLHLLIKNNVN